MICYHVMTVEPQFPAPAAHESEEPPLPLLLSELLEAAIPTAPTTTAPTAQYHQGQLELSSILVRGA